ALARRYGRLQPTARRPRRESEWLVLTRRRRNLGLEALREAAPSEQHRFAGRHLGGLREKQKADYWRSHSTAFQAWLERSCRAPRFFTRLLMRVGSVS